MKQATGAQSLNAFTWKKQKNKKLFGEFFWEKFKNDFLTIFFLVYYIDFFFVSLNIFFSELREHLKPLPQFPY